MAGCDTISASCGAGAWAPSAGKAAFGLASCVAAIAGLCVRQVAKAASVASTGLWFELILIQLLARWAYDQDPQDPRTLYALAEIGDETRHVTMFAKSIARMGAPTYRPRPLIRQLARQQKIKLRETSRPRHHQRIRSATDAERRAIEDRIQA